jgi:class 3 adenylate cyclase/tetratricopeptide (TPR) repeat protein
MTFDELLAQILALLQRERRVSYRALKRRYDLDDEYLEDLKAEIIQAKKLAIDEEGTVLIWTGEPAAERRQLTVLFCDLADSTRLARQLDPEDLREVIRAYQATCVTVIQRFAGHVAQYLGDGLLVYFGYPQAHEDDAQRAVRTGLGLLEAMGTLQTRPLRDKSVSLAVRIGIHTGQVVVGEMGSGGRHEHLALGDTPNLAARLQGLAEPNTVVMSDTTSRLVQGYFTCKDHGAYTLKGIDTPVHVYQVIGESAARSRLDVAGPTGLTPLVGREAEVTLLRERWAQSTEGHGQVMLLSGEAGIGKSRLVHIFMERIADTGVPRLTLRCSPYHTNSPLYPVIEHLQRLLHWHGEVTSDARLAALEQALRTANLPLAETVPLLAALLSGPMPERYPPLILNPQHQKQKTQEALITLLLAEAAQQPVLVVWEDLHWADPSTLELLGLVIDQVPTASLLLVLTARPEFRLPWAPRSHLTQCALTRLAHQQVEEMVRRMTGGTPLPAEVVQQIVSKTDGIPLFVEELVKTVLESGLVRKAADRYILIGPLPPLAIPATLQDALMARLDRLAAVKDVAQLAAVLGREFSYKVLQAVTPLEEPLLQQSLAQLVATELLYQRGHPPEATYIFKHALVQDAAYQSLLRSTRQQYHQRIAQVLETRFPHSTETQPEVLAQHYTAAGMHAQALSYWQRAGQRAQERWAHREAAASFEQALSALSYLPETHHTREQAVDLRLALYSTLQPAGGWHFERTLVYLREAETLAETLDDRRRLAQVYIALGHHFSNRGVHAQAIAFSQRALALATASGDAVLRIRADYYLGVVYHDQSEWRQAADCFQRTVAPLERAHERFGQMFPPDVTVIGRAILAWDHAELGRFAEGRTLGEEGLWIAEAVVDPRSLMFAHWGLGRLFVIQGDPDRGLLLLERAMRICREANLSFYFAMVAGSLAAAYTLGGRVADAVPLFTQALEQTMVTGRILSQTLLYLSLGGAHLLAGRREEAQTCAERSLTLAHERQQRGYRAYVLRLLGDIAARREPPERESAEAHYQQAIVLAKELGTRPLQAHCHRGLGTLYATAGQPEQACVELSTAIALYRDMGMTFWLPQAEAVLARVESTEALKKRER